MPDPVIQLVSNAWRSVVPDVEALAARAASACLSRTKERAGTERMNLTDAELTLVLADDRLLRQLNRKHRGQDRPTNVLAFAAAAPPSYLGDVILSHETLQREAHAQGKPPGDHLCHLVVHGILHLLGYDHDTDQSAGEMESKEINILSTLGIPDPYADAGSMPRAQASGERHG